ncbi:MAG: ChaN family lipoprotein [Candidatus Cloacimonetes bacterium]|jgi:uncharacterized iron-regulated protein|nr:ChaN family lipoprotein [Candidatus Cloacimonadota bacterium]NLO43710.1 ChaN family lipoprotein [Candidatus Cloacimonadota bacterium]
MKQMIILILLIFLATSLIARVKIFNSESKEELDLDSFVNQLSAYDVIFFGEMHGTKPVHALEHAILPGLWKTDNSLILSFEMWERDHQDKLDAYLKSEISLDELLNQDRVWDNYDDYLPMLNFAKEKGLKVVAANVPRFFAAQTVREGLSFVDDLEPEQRKLIAETPYFEDEAYETLFAEVMDMGKGFSPDSDMLKRFFQAQVIKDATMAESIADAHKESPESLIVHYNGDFHSRGYLGTVTALKNHFPELKIAVITTIVIHEDETDVSSHLDENQGSHFIMVNRKDLGGQR